MGIMSVKQIQTPVGGVGIQHQKVIVILRGVQRYHILLCLCILDQIRDNHSTEIRTARDLENGDWEVVKPYGVHTMASRAMVCGHYPSSQTGICAIRNSRVVYSTPKESVNVDVLEIWRIVTGMLIHLICSQKRRPLRRHLRIQNMRILRGFHGDFVPNFYVPLYLSILGVQSS
tara:strand:+ start:16280 stop:16801 length:522 start_codon:yes stop_codon:yes gene_type:complete